MLRPMTATPGDTLSDTAALALDRWVRDRGVGSGVSDVAPLAGGTQNIVVRLTVDDRTLVLRRPPLHPRANSNRTMQREIAVLTTLAGSSVPHPRFVAGCEDLEVLGVVFYLMEDVDGFNPGTEVSDAYVRDAGLRHRSASTMRPIWPGWVTRRGAGYRLRRCGGRDPFWHARFRSFLPCWRATATTATGPTNCPVSGGWPTGCRATGHPTASPASCTATPT